MSSSTGDMSGMADAFSSGSSGVGSNSFGFSMPSDISSGGGDSFAGLSGIGSGMSLPTQDAGANSFGFAMPSSGVNLPGLSNGLGAASKTVATPQQNGLARGGFNQGRVRLPQETFASGTSDLMPSGTTSGSQLIQLLAKLRPGQ